MPNNLLSLTMNNAIPQECFSLQLIVFLSLVLQNKAFFTPFVLYVVVHFTMQWSLRNTENGQ